MARFAAELGLAEPALPWHSARQRPAELAASLGIVAGTAAKIGGDVVLLSQTEVGEVAEAAARGEVGVHHAAQAQPGARRRGGHGREAWHRPRAGRARARSAPSMSAPPEAGRPSGRPLPTCSP